MAVGTEGKLGKFEQPGYLSDDSDFYGDEATKQDLEDRARNFNAGEWWENKTPSLTELAIVNIAAAVKPKPVTLYNPYEGDSRCARQLGETVEEFLERLPPRTISASEDRPWIYIANPYRKAPKAEENRSGVVGEGPPDEESDWAQFVVLGGNLLEELTGIRHDIEKKKESQANVMITKAVNVQKDSIVQKLLETAVKLHCTSGKWMLFCEPCEVNVVWSVVARETAKNELGIAAKVALDEGDDRKQRLICVYTKDFTDMEDIVRVVKKMKERGLVELKRRIYYKCDAYTYLGLKSHNEYNIKASLYNSTEVLKPKDQKKDQKLEGFFYRKK